MNNLVLWMNGSIRWSVLPNDIAPRLLSLLLRWLLLPLLHPWLVQNVQQAPHLSATCHGGPNIEYPHLDSQFNESRAAQFAGVAGHDASFENQGMAPYEGRYFEAIPQ
jgi:hypothetical protein